VPIQDGGLVDSMETSMTTADRLMGGCQRLTDLYPQLFLASTCAPRTRPAGRPSGTSHGPDHPTMPTFHRNPNYVLQHPGGE
jgi:hypothetical protein